MDRSKPAPSGSSSEDLERARGLSQRLKGVGPPAAPAAQPYVSFGGRAAPAPALAPPAPPPPPVAAAAPHAPPPPPAPAAPPAPPASALRPTLPPAAPGPVPTAPPAAPAARAPMPPAAPPAPPRPSLPLMPKRDPLRLPATGFGPLAWNRLLDACAAAVAADASFLMDPHGLVVASRGARPAEELEGVGARLMVAFDQADRIEGEQGALSLTVETPHGSLQGLRLRTSDGAVLTLGLLVPGGLTADRQARLLALVGSLQA